MKWMTFLFLVFFVRSFAVAGNSPSDLPNALPNSLPGQIPGESLYQFKMTWANQDAQNIQLEKFRGAPVLLSLVYLNCSFSCPTVIMEIQSIESKLSDEAKKNLQIVIVSFDPKRDTPKSMKAYAQKRKLDLTRWNFITNKDDSKIRELAAALNFKYQKIEKGEYTHSFMISLLNKDGVVVDRADSLNQDKSKMVEQIKSMNK